MPIEVVFKSLVDSLLFISCLIILGACLFISLKTRFVQLRLVPLLFSLLKENLKKKVQEEKHTVSPYKALLTAMSTTLGISTIVAPVIAIRLGGPGAMLGFLLTSLLGSAATFAEVSLSVQHRRVDKTGIMGGPMQYLKHIFSPKVAKWYALSCLILMMAWSGAQANQLAAIFNSPMLGSWQVPTMVSGGVIAFLVLFILMGGIKRVGSFSSKLVPIMFVLYLGSCFWILLVNVTKWGEVLTLICHSAFKPYAMGSGIMVGGIVSALRWGVFKGLQTNEAGIGTQTIPHSMAETSDPFAQGTLAMVSTYMAGFVAFLSGFVALLTGTWQDSSLPIGISMVAASFQMYFSYFGVIIVAICALLFGFGTILGNSYNGSQCFGYLTNNKGIHYYFLATIAMIFAGSVAEVTTVWSMVDLVLVFMALPHIAGLVFYAKKNPKALLHKV